MPMLFTVVRRSSIWLLSLSIMQRRVYRILANERCLLRECPLNRSSLTPPIFNASYHFFHLETKRT